MSTLTLTIRFDSDWTIGTGKATSGFIDQAVKRDHRGLPIVESGYVLGLWRDAAESVASAFGSSDDKDLELWEGAVNKLFGKGGVHGDALLRTRGDAHLVWADYLTSDAPTAALYRRQLVVHRYATQIDEIRGVAKNETLRIREAVRAGTTLEIEVELPDAWNSGMPWPVELLLAASLRRLDHLSGKRRRGAGRCRVTTPKWDLAAVVNKHAAQLLNGAAAQDLKDIEWPFWGEGIARPDTDDTERQPCETERQPWRLRFRYAIDLKQPVVASKRVVGNTIESHDFLPGAFVLPIVARAIEDAAGTAIADAHLVVTPAHPDIREPGAVPSGPDVMSARTPQTWISAEKGAAWKSSGEAVDAWSAGEHDGHKPIWGWAVAKFGAEAPSVLVGGESLELSAHPSIEDGSQRPGEDGLFALQAIPAGRRLVGEIWDDGFLDADALQRIEKLSGSQRFGRGRKRRGLGQLTILKVDSSEQPLDEAWPEGTALRVRLLTDTVLLDAFGYPQPSATALATELARLLEVDVTAGRDAVTVSRHESWNTTHGLPRTSIVALAAGSVVEVTLHGPVPMALLDDVLASGLGELRVEGFGRVALLDAAVPHLIDAHRPSPGAVSTSADLPGEPMDGDWKDDWAALRTAMWADELQRRALAWPTRVQKMWFGKELESGDLRSLRTAARESLRLDNPEPLNRWCGRKIEAAAKLKGDVKQSVKGRSTSPIKLAAAALLKPEASDANDVPEDLGGLSAVRVVATFLLAYTEAEHRKQVAAARQQQTMGERHGA